MFGNSLAEEYRLLKDRFGFSRQEVRALILQGIQAAWLPEEKKQALTDQFVQTPVWHAK
jgi:adenosine deaminase